MVAVAVAGGGALGTMVALIAASRGWEVSVFEARPTLMSAASAANEGKVHLGPVFALGANSTHEVMLRGALTFAPILDEAVGYPIDWAELVSDEFEYLVMPGSLLDAAGLAQRYAQINATFEVAAATLGNRYLAHELSDIADTHHSADPTTGRPVFATRERAIDPLRLRSILLARLHSLENVVVHTSCRVLALEPAAGGVEVTWVRGDEPPVTQRFDSVVDCAWENQLSLAPERARGNRNFRLKTAVRLQPYPDARTVTLVQGPFGDVVSHRDYVYASWYPDARLTNEFGPAPSVETDDLLGSIIEPDQLNDAQSRWREGVAATQVAALQRLGLVPHGVAAGELVGGIIVGHGAPDIDRVESELHDRSEFGAHDFGGLIIPSNFKLTTCPLAAMLAVRAIESSHAPTVLT